MMAPGRTVLSLSAALLIAMGTTDALAQHPQDILVIANKKVSVDSATPEQIKSIFLKKRTTWKSGGKAVPLNAKAGTPLREKFQELVLGMTDGEERIYWEKQKIRSATDGPTEFANPLKAIFRVKGSVSYIFRSQYKEGVAKILLVIPHR